mmetsp:Transcript_416/g.594  ORF Transcript_416/g.594 Transcript_416/m.594 type:complete len:206 (-) Transcript_416:438-1055(-)
MDLEFLEYCRVWPVASRADEFINRDHRSIPQGNLHPPLVILLEFLDRSPPLMRDLPTAPPAFLDELLSENGQRVPLWQWVVFNSFVKALVATGDPDNFSSLVRTHEGGDEGYCGSSAPHNHGGLPLELPNLLGQPLDYLPPQLPLSKRWHPALSHVIPITPRSGAVAYLIAADQLFLPPLLLNQNFKPSVAAVLHVPLILAGFRH